MSSYKEGINSETSLDFNTTDDMRSSDDLSVPTEESQDPDDPSQGATLTWKSKRIIILVSVLVVAIILCFLVVLGLLYYVYFYDNGEGFETLDLEHSNGFGTYSFMDPKIFRIPPEKFAAQLDQGMRFFEAKINQYCCPEDVDAGFHHDACDAIVKGMVVNEIAFSEEDIRTIYANFDAHYRQSQQPQICYSHEEFRAEVLYIRPVDTLYDCSGKCSASTLEEFMSGNDDLIGQIMERAKNKASGYLKEKIRGKSTSEQKQGVSEFLSDWYERKGVAACANERQGGEYELENSEDFLEPSTRYDVDKEYQKKVMAGFCEKVRPQLEVESFPVEIKCQASPNEVVCFQKEFFMGAVESGNFQPGFLERQQNLGMNKNRQYPVGG